MKSTSFIVRLLMLSICTIASNASAMNFYVDAPHLYLGGGEERTKREEQREKLNDVDALTKGIVTTWDTRNVPTPPAVTREKITVKAWEAQDTKSTNSSVEAPAGG